MTRQEILAIAKPILFNTPMVQAIDRGNKTATRRVIKPQLQPQNTYSRGFCTSSTERSLIGCASFAASEYDGYNTDYRKPPYQPDDLLYVRETWYYESHMYDPSEGAALHRYKYRALTPDYPTGLGVGKQGWHPSIHMPKEAARLFLRVTAVRVERLQDITEEEAKAEGVAPVVKGGSYRGGFQAVWQSIVKSADLPLYGWAVNPWVWAIEFERVMPDD